MINSVFAKVFGTSNERAVKRLLPVVTQVNDLEASVESLTDEQLRAKTDEFRARVAKAIEGIDPKAEPDELYAAEKTALDELMPEAFAVVREAGKRAVGMRHFDVQVIGGMRAPPGQNCRDEDRRRQDPGRHAACYLNALAGRGVHVVTVNDYLAKRDAEWMGKIYGFLGLTVGVIVHDLSDPQRRDAYAADITYGTNNEFGFDYLRDNMKFELADMVQRGQYFCIVDEVDSILIDEARTPLIISGPTDQTTDKYARVNVIIPNSSSASLPRRSTPRPTPATTSIDEKARSITVTDEGWEKIEALLGIGNIADPENWDLEAPRRSRNQGAQPVSRDVEYVVKDGEVIIVDEFTGRLMPGRRWSDGLHQAVEAKEGVSIRKEDQTLATITFQNYFRLYKKLSGMTGTAETEAAEFDKIYKLDIVVIPPTARCCALKIRTSSSAPRRKSTLPWRMRSRACMRKAAGAGGHHEHREVRAAVEILKRKGVRHVVLNAKFHEKEAEIVAQAGRLGMVTIATNMAGRGTDILLGGNADFMARQDLVKRSWRARSSC